MTDKKYKFIDGNVIELTPSEVLEVEAREAEWDAHLAEEVKTQYQRDRQAEYPSVGNQLDAILKHLNYRRIQGEDLVKDLDNIVGAWLNVKSRYPKNGSN